MTTELDLLRRAFVDDHRILTRGLRDLLLSVRATDVAAAVRQADELDRAVGPHMAFEEHVYYPELRRVLGDEFVDRLYEEHATGLGAVRRLVGHDATEPLPEPDVLIEELTTAFEHAKSCGTLLSHLSRLEGPDLARMRTRLEALRTRGVRWTEMAAEASDPA